jgi:hypothetical protein
MTKKDIFTIFAGWDDIPNFHREQYPFITIY